MNLTTPAHKIIDIGLNLAHDSFGHDVESVLDRARAARVEHMVVTGSDFNGTRKAIELSKTFPHRLRATAGIHPHHATVLSADRRLELKTLLTDVNVIAAGECGLDFFRNFSPPADQEKAFHMQLELAGEIRKPVFLHQRAAHDSFVAILREHRTQWVGGVAHCFTEGWDKARVYIEMGLYIGVTGWLCDERRGRELRETVRSLPLDRILIETDAPYLLPRDLDPKPVSRRNEPMYLPHVLRVLATLRNEDPELVAAATTANAVRLFGWPLIA